MRLHSLLLVVGAAFMFASSAALAQQPERLSITNANGFYVLAVPVSNLTLAIPDAGMTIESANIGGSTSNPRYFNLSVKSRNLVISGWFEPSGRFPGARATWEGDTAAWKSRGQPEPVDVSFERVEGWDAVLYDLPIKSFTNSHIRAHYVKNGTWIDAHISISNNSSSMENRRALRDFLKSLVVTAKTGG